MRSDLKRWRGAHAYPRRQEALRLLYNRAAAQGTHNTTVAEADNTNGVIGNNNVVTNYFGGSGSSGSSGSSELMKIIERQQETIDKLISLVRELLSQRETKQTAE